MNISSLKNNKIWKNKFFQDSSWSLLGNIIGKGLSLIAGIFVARYLGKEIFGEYGIIKTSIMMIATFSTYGLGYTATKYIAEYKNNKKEYVKPFIKYASRITLVLCGTMAILLLFFADYFSEFVLKAPQLNNALRILSVLIIFNGQTTTQIGVLAGFGKFKQLARINSIIGVVNFLFSILFTYYGGLNGALLALLLTQLLNWFINNHEVKKSKKEFVFEDEADTTLLLKDILTFSTPVALQEMTYAVTSWLSSYLLIKLTSYGELGMFNAAMQWNAIILFIPGILRNVVLSHLSENNSDENKHNKIMKRTLMINFVITAGAVFFIIVFSTFFMDKIYGNSFQGISSLINIASISTIFASMSNVYAQAYMSKNKNWLMFTLRFLRDSSTLLSSFILLYYFDSNFSIAERNNDKPVIPFVWYIVSPGNKKYGNEYLSEASFARYINFIRNYSFNDKKVLGVVWWEPSNVAFIKVNNKNDNKFKDSSDVLDNYLKLIK